MSTVGLSAGIYTGNDRARARVRTTGLWGEESKDPVGCIISMRKDFIGKV